MSYHKKESLFQKIIFSRVMLGCVIFFIIFMSFAVYSVAEKSFRASKNRELAERTETNLAQKETTLTQKIAEVNTPEGQEKLLREKYPVVKPGEGVVIITDAQEPKVEASEEDQSKKGFWNFLKSLFD